MDTLLNFRDFGGDLTADGSRVRRGLLFRSGHMGDLGPAATAELLAHDFALIVDLRFMGEREKQRTPPALADRTIAHDGTEATDAPHMAIMKKAVAGQGSVAEAYHAFYTTLPFDVLYQRFFARAVAAIAKTQGKVLIHCSAGKDRTGTLAAILLSLLGVPDEAIAADFVRTNHAPGMERLRSDVTERFAGHDLTVEPGLIDALLGVEPAYVVAALSVIREAFGSVEDYVIASGVSKEDLAALRVRYLATPD